VSDLDALLKACDHIEHSEVDDLEKVRLARAVKAVAEHLERAQKTNDAIRKALLSAFWVGAIPPSWRYPIEDSGHE
jgi:hypothetical protein